MCADWDAQHAQQEKTLCVLAASLFEVEDAVYPLFRSTMKPALWTLGSTSRVTETAGLNAECLKYSNY